MIFGNVCCFAFVFLVAGFLCCFVASNKTYAVVCFAFIVVFQPSILHPTPILTVVLCRIGPALLLLMSPSEPTGLT